MSRAGNAANVFTNCLLCGCPDGKINAEKCNHCGFDADEDARRKELPIVRGEDGLHRKHVGVPEVKEQ